jgi:hypothetical protein
MITFEVLISSELASARDGSGKPPSAALGMNSARWQAEGACSGQPGGLALRLAMPPNKNLY